MTVTKKTTVTYEYSVTRQLYSENGNIIRDGKYYGFSYYRWGFWKDASGYNRLFKGDALMTTDEGMIDFILNSLDGNPLHPRATHGGVRIRKVTKTDVTISEEDEVGNFYEEKSSSKRAEVIFERMVTKEEADAKAEQLVELEAEDARLDAAMKERERIRQEEEQAAAEAQVEVEEVSPKKGLLTRLLNR